MLGSGVGMARKEAIIYTYREKITQNYVHHKKAVWADNPLHTGL